MLYSSTTPSPASTSWHGDAPVPKRIENVTHAPFGTLTPSAVVTRRSPLPSNRNAEEGDVYPHPSSSTAPLVSHAPASMEPVLNASATWLTRWSSVCPVAFLPQQVT